MRWSYGITTVPERLETTFPISLASLQGAGFTEPRLFVDGASEGFDKFGLPVTYRTPRIKAWGNWILGLLELYTRDPLCHRYAMFQDDCLAVRGLKEYLTHSPYPNKGYQNLYTFPINRRETEGWDEAAWDDNPPRTYQFGKGAVGLVFSQEAVKIILQSSVMVNKPLSDRKPTECVDGSIVHVMNQAGWVEYCHTPSLLQHIGEVSTLNHGKFPKAEFRGENWDARELLRR